MFSNTPGEGAGFPSGPPGGSNANNTELMGGMSVEELYNIMHEMKKIVQQNPEQARNILVAQPGMTRALFQAQMRLGMIKAPTTG
eukprot:7549345-Pyramimonas_sp.AAC.1